MNPNGNASSNSTASESIARWAIESPCDAWPSPVRALIRRAFIDTLAVTVLGARMAAPRQVAALEFERGAPGAASVYGMGRQCDPMGAALVNGTSAHAELFDDNSAPMIAHPSAPLVCSLLPLAQTRGSTGRQVLQAYGVGFEVGVALGRAMNPGLYERGWHVTRTLGLFGAVAACARLIGLDVDRTTHALGIAASMTGGIRQNFGTMSMPLHVGLTCRDAVHAVLLAERGFEADRDALGGRYGFFNVFAGGAPGWPTFGSPLELQTSGIIFKPYPCGAPTHAAVDAALALRARLGSAIDTLESVTCFVHPWNAMTLRDGIPTDPLRAKVSMRFCVAAALRHGRLSWREFSDETLAEPGLQDLMRRVSIRTADDLPDNGEFPAEVEVRTRDGRCLSHRSDVPPGGSTRPLGDEQVIAKLRDCAAAALSPAAIEAVIEQVARLDTLQEVGRLCVILEGAKG